MLSYSVTSHVQSLHTTSCCATSVLRPNYVLFTMVYIFVTAKSYTTAAQQLTMTQSTSAKPETEIRLVPKTTIKGVTI